MTSYLLEHRRGSCSFYSCRPQKVRGLGKTVVRIPVRLVFFPHLFPFLVVCASFVPPKPLRTRQPAPRRPDDTVPCPGHADGPRTTH